MKKTTQKQERFLKFIDTFCNENGYSPSVREIASGLGLASTSGVQSMIDRLSSKGLLFRELGAARTLSVAPQSFSAPFHETGIPVLGRIRAGVPVTAEENIEGYLPLKSFLDASSGGFFLVVEGESMKDEGIMPGDYAFIKPQKYISNNQIGAFRINGEVTLKKFKQTPEGMFLLPANKDFSPIILHPEDEFEVIGKFVMLLRLADRKYDGRFL